MTDPTEVRWAWMWHEGGPDLDGDEVRAGYGYHMEHLLARMPRDAQTDDMKSDIEWLLAEVERLHDEVLEVRRNAMVLDRAAAEQRDRAERAESERNEERLAKEWWQGRAARVENDRDVYKVERDEAQGALIGTNDRADHLERTLADLRAERDELTAEQTHGSVLLEHLWAAEAKLRQVEALTEQPIWVEDPDGETFGPFVDRDALADALRGGGQ